MNARTGYCSLPIWVKCCSLIMICMLLSSSLFFFAPSKSAAASGVVGDDDKVNGYCECVTYVVYRLFQRTLTGEWYYAAQMDTPYYWSAEHLKESKLKPAGLARELKSDAKAGDVIIFGSYSTFSVYYASSTVRYDATKKMFIATPGYVQTTLGKSGHIGIVRKANYDSKSGGWWLTIESANFPAVYGKWDINMQFSNNRDGTGSFYCNRVSSQQQIFVPNYSNIHFWRVKP